MGCRPTQIHPQRRRRRFVLCPGSHRHLPAGRQHSSAAQRSSPADPRRNREPRTRPRTLRTGSPGWCSPHPPERSWDPAASSNYSTTTDSTMPPSTEYDQPSRTGPLNRTWEKRVADARPSPRKKRRILPNPPFRPEGSRHARLGRPPRHLTSIGKPTHPPSPPLSTTNKRAIDRS